MSGNFRCSRREDKSLIVASADSDRMFQLADDRNVLFWNRFVNLFWNLGKMRALLLMPRSVLHDIIDGLHSLRAPVLPPPLSARR